MFVQEDGYFSLSSIGYVAFILLLVAVVVAVGFFRKKNTTTHFQTKQLVFSALSLALAFVLSYIQPYKLPWGGSVTLCSMLFICLIGYWYGLKAGLATAFAYSILQFLQSGGSYILTPLQACLDYFFAFTALGFSGLFYQKKNGLIKGYVLGVFLRGLFHTIGGYLYWMEYMPDNFPASLSIIYPIVYNYSYLLIEGVATILLLSLPAVKDALKQIQKTV